MKRCTLHPPSSWNKRYLTQIVIRERNEIESARTIPLTTLFHESLFLSLLYPQLPFSPLKNEKCLFRNVRTVSSRFDAFIWEFIMMSQLRRSFAYSNNERWDKKIKKKSRGIACNGFTNNRKKDVNEKSNGIFAVYENTHGE